MSGNENLLLAEVVQRLQKLLEAVATASQESSGAQDKLRAVLLGKMDGLQGTMDLLRQDVRNSWNTADFALTNLRNIREESDKILNMISTMQRQQQILASQVEELRRNAADNESNGLRG